MAKRRGRPRKTGPREANGRLLRAIDRGTPESRHQREQLAGKGAGESSLASFALGVLRHCEVIDQQGFEAGLRFEALNKRYLLLKGLRRPHPKISSYGAPRGRTAEVEVEEASYRACHDAYEDALAALKAAPDSSTRREVVNVIVYGRLPAWFARRGDPRPGDLRLRGAFAEGMEALRRHFQGRRCLTSTRAEAPKPRQASAA